MAADPFETAYELGLDYIRNWLRQFAELLDEPEIQHRFEASWKKYLDE